MQGVQVITQTPGGPVVARIADISAPQTRAELEALNIRRIQFGQQIEGLRERREALSEDLVHASREGAAAIRARIDQTDQQIAELERAYDQLNAQIAAAPAHVLTAQVQQQRGPGDQFLMRLSNDLIPLVAILSVFVFGPLAIAMSRLLWRRASAPPRPALVDQAAMQRLEQLQQSVDAMAIEVERISEGQRFVSKLLNDRERSPADAKLTANTP